MRDKYEYSTSFSQCKANKYYFNAARICEIIQEKVIGFIGDSMTNQFVTSFINKLFMDMEMPCIPLCRVNTDNCEEVYIINCEQYSEIYNKKIF